MKSLLVFILSILTIVTMRADAYRATPAQYRTVSSVSHFYTYIQPQVEDQLSLAVALFYNSKEGAESEKQDKDERKQVQEFRTYIKKMIKNQLDAFRQTSKSFKEVDFLSIDVANKDNSQLAQTFAIQYSPEIRLFRRGKPVRINDKLLAIKGDFAQEILLNESTISSFVHKHFDIDIQTILNAKKKAKDALDLARASAPRYTNVSFGMGYGPYWGGYYGPGWGWGGWGWGGRCGFGWC